jgi:hypothetical protein
MAALAQLTADGAERARMHSEQLAIARDGRAGTYWRFYDMTDDTPRALGRPDRARWMVVEQADDRIRTGNYR